MKKILNPRVFSPDKFRAIMAEKNLMMMDLAEFVGMSKQTVSTYSQGKSTPDTNTFLRIVAYLNCSIEDITNEHTERVTYPETANI